jgi:RHS repeat-associated protein
MTLMPGLRGRYDAWNRLVEARSAADVLIARYDYNGLNHRVRRAVGNVVTTSFFNAAWQELESTTSGQTTVNVWGLRYIDDLALRERGSERLYSLADPNWNAVAVINAAGTVQERMRYDAFGRVTWLNAAFAVKAGTGFAWNRTFTGQVLDGETGMMLYRNRFYHTGLGRFVQRDPIGYEAEDMSLYRYVGNQPNGWLDPMGLRTWGEWAREQMRRARDRVCNAHDKVSNHPISQCLCGIANVADMINGPAFFIPGVNVAASAAEIVDCLCNISTTAGKFCKSGQQGRFGPRRPATHYAFLTLLDCASMLPGLATGGTADLILDAATQFAQDYVNFDDGDPMLGDLLCACTKIW